MRHAGYAALADMVDSAAFIKMLANKEVDQVIFCGHSLGGAIAKLVAVNTLLRLEVEKRRPKNILCVTISDPMACDEDFTAAFYQVVPFANDIFHSFVVEGDIVPVVSSYRNGIILSVTSTVATAAKTAMSVELKSIDLLVRCFQRDNEEAVDGSDVSFFDKAVNSFVTSVAPNYQQLGTFHLFHQSEYVSLTNEAAVARMLK
eukprot:gene11156-14177_t